MKRLERENEQLRVENAFLNCKGVSLTSVRLQFKYRAIRDLYATENLSVILLCEISGASRAGFYKLLQYAKQLENESILGDIQAIYARVGGIYGCRRMKLNINSDNIRYMDLREKNAS